MTLRTTQQPVTASTDALPVFVQAYGKLIAVTRIATSDDEANAYMTAHEGEGVVTVQGGEIFIARCTDLGTDLAEVPPGPRRIVPL